MIQTKQGIKKSKRAQHLLFLKRPKGYTDITLSNSCHNSPHRVTLELMDNSLLHTERWSHAPWGCVLPGSALVTVYSIYHSLILLGLSGSSSEGFSSMPFSGFAKAEECLSLPPSFDYFARFSFWHKTSLLTQRCDEMHRRGLFLSPLTALFWGVTVPNLW